MAQTFDELVIGGVLVAPIVGYGALTLLLVVLLRPVLHRIRFAGRFSNPAIAELSLYVTILGLITLF